MLIVLPSTPQLPLNHFHCYHNGGDGETPKRLNRIKPKRSNFERLVIDLGPLNDNLCCEMVISTQAPIIMRNFCPVPLGTSVIHLVRSYIGQSHLPSIIITFVFPFPALKIQIEILIAFEASVFSICKFKALAETTDDYEPMPPRPQTPFRSSGTSEEVEGNNLQHIPSTPGGKPFEHVSHSGPINYFGHSTSVFHRPLDREIYYEIVADSNELQKRVCKL